MHIALDGFAKRKCKIKSLPNIKKNNYIDKATLVLRTNEIILLFADTINSV